MGFQFGTKKEEPKKENKIEFEKKKSRHLSLNKSYDNA